MINYGQWFRPASPWLSRGGGPNEAPGGGGCPLVLPNEVASIFYEERVILFSLIKMGGGGGEGGEGRERGGGGGGGDG